MEDSVNPAVATKVAPEKTDVIKSKPDESIDNLRKLLRPIKYSLVDLFISLARVFFFWLPGGDVGKGQALMVAHFVGGCVLYSLYFILPPNQAFRMFIFFFFAIVIVQQIVFRGCVITKAEQRLTGTDDTILDPWIRLSGFEPTRELRVVCSIGVVGSMTMTLLMNTILDQFRMFSQKMSFTLETTDQYDATKYTPMGTVMSNNVEAVSFFRAILGAFQAPFGGKNVAIQTAVDRLTERGIIQFKNKVAATFPNTLKVVGLRTNVSEVGGEDSQTFLILHVTGTCLAPFGQSGGKNKHKTKVSKRNNRKTRRNI